MGSDSACVQVVVEMAGEGFMCPFLTPQVVDILEQRAHWVDAQPAESRIRFVVPLAGAWSPEEISEILKDVGYPAEGASFLQWDTLTTIPNAPEP